MRLLLDEHVSPAIAEELRRRGCDVVAAAEVGLHGQPDATLLSLATTEGRAVVTANYADFRGLHELRLSRGEHHVGIVYVSRSFALAESGFGGLIGAVDRLLYERSADDALESAETWLVG